MSESPADRLHALRAAHWQELLDEHPETAISMGYPSSRAWTDWSVVGVDRRRRSLAARRDALLAIDPADLDDEDALDHRVALDDALRTFDVARYRNEALAVDQVNGPQIAVPNTLADLARGLGGDAAPYLDRLGAVPELIEGVVEQLRTAAADDIVLPEAIARLVPPQIDQVSTAEGLEDRFVAPLAAASTAGATATARRLAESAVAPALQHLAEVYRDEYLPKARVELGLGSLPDGEAWYRALSRWYTTTDLEPDELQRIGTDELVVIGERLDEVRARLRSHGLDPDEPGARTPEDLVAVYDRLCRGIDARLGELFVDLPELGFVIDEMPAAIAAEAPAAYYVPGSARLGRVGRFQVNTTRLDSRPRREAVALAMHECVPGHHLQFAVAQENERLGPLRRHAHIDAYIEGWALYAERLAADLGLFDDDPLAEYGALTFAAWRAARLVVDPGLHLHGWSRERAVAFMIEHTGRPAADLAVEVDRYVAWPGQALGYKVGELAIRSLRERAEAADVDLRRFHDRVLADGPLPLAVLDDVVGSWIERNR